MVATETLLQQLEERMLLLVSEVENLRLRNAQLSHEVSALKIERESFQIERNTMQLAIDDLHSKQDVHTKSLNELISLLDAAGPALDVVQSVSPLEAIPAPVALAEVPVVKTPISALANPHMMSHAHG